MYSYRFVGALRILAAPLLHKRPDHHGTRTAPEAADAAAVKFQLGFYAAPIRKYVTHLKCTAFFDSKFVVVWINFLTNFFLYFLVFRFQKACVKYGVPDVDLFQTTDLFDRKNIALVTTTIFAVGRMVKYNVFLGFKTSTKLN